MLGANAISILHKLDEVLKDLKMIFADTIHTPKGKVILPHVIPATLFAPVPENVSVVVGVTA
jgi:hypothetical protein